MEVNDKYFETKNRLWLVSGLLITWDFFTVQKDSISDVDFDFINLNISRDAIPFLLSFLVVYYTYNFAYHWKTKGIDKPSHIQNFDYFITITTALLSCFTNYLYLFFLQKTNIRLIDLLEPQGWLLGTVPMIALSYQVQKPKRPKIAPSNGFDRMAKWFSRTNVMLFVTLIPAFTTLFLTSKLMVDKYQVSIAKAVYFGFYNLLTVIVFTWALLPAPTVKIHSQS